MMKTRAYSKKVRAGKVLCIVLAVMLAALGLGGCSSTKLAEAFDEAAVKEAAQAAVDHLNAGEYEECVAMMSQEMQEALSAEALASAAEGVFAKAGAFQEYKSVAVVGQKDKAGTDYAVAVVVADFENGKVTYNVSFDTNMEIVGFWMK